MVEGRAAVSIFKEAEERAGEGEDNDGHNRRELEDVGEEASEHQVERADRVEHVQVACLPQ